MELKTVTAEELLQTIRQGQPFFALRLRKHPEQARIFRKYGAPEAVAAMLRDGSKDVFFDNGTMCMTGSFLIDKGNPESFQKSKICLVRRQTPFFFSPLLLWGREKKQRL